MVIWDKLVSIILPTYNEAGNIVPLVKTIRATLRKHGIRGEIIIVDDNSPDGTAKIVQKTFGKVKAVKLFIRKKEKGLATAIAFAIEKAHGEGILVMDTDFNHDPKEIPLLLRKLVTHKMVIGSRYIRGGGMENKLRYILSYMFNMYLRFLLGYTIHDNLSGFFAMRRSDLIQLQKKTIFYGFGDYFMRLIYQAFSKKMNIVEIPVYYKNRVWGQSKSRFLPMFIDYSRSALQLRFKTT